MSDFTFELGAEAKDSITGMAGIVTARAQYLGAGNRYMVEPKIADPSKSSAQAWFDEGRLAPAAKG